MGIHMMPPLFEMVIVPPGPGAPYIFTPDPSPGVTSVDGWIRKYVKTTWANIISGDGTEVYDDSDEQSLLIVSASTVNQWVSVGRAYFLFDTSPLPDGCVIDAAELHIWVTSKNDELAISPSYNVYAADPASDIQLVVSDYCKIGSTPYATAIPYSDIVGGAYNVWTLNAAGRAAIQKAGVTGFCLRNANYDAAGIEPTWSSFKISQISVKFADGEEASKPLLYVWVK